MVEEFKLPDISGKILAQRKKSGNVKSSLKVSFESTIIVAGEQNKTIKTRKGLRDSIRKTISDLTDDNAEDVYDTIGDTIGALSLEMKHNVIRRYKDQDLPDDKYWRDKGFRSFNGSLTSGTPIDFKRRPSRATFKGFQRSKKAPVTSISSVLKEVEVDRLPGGKGKRTAYPNGLKSEYKDVAKRSTAQISLSSMIETGTRSMRSGGDYTTLAGETFTSSTGYHTHDRIVKAEWDKLRRGSIGEIEQNIKTGRN